MHFLGKSYKVWAVTPSEDIIPLIDIPHWDFHWQRYYEYPQIVKLPKGSVIESEGWYDNTEANHDNPNSPPVTAVRGTKTTDEMFLCYFIYAPYQAGDEDIIIESGTTLSNVQIVNEVTQIDLYPNPAGTSIYLKGEIPNVSDMNFRLINLLGQEFTVQYQLQPTNEIKIDISLLEDGCYFLVWEAKGKVGVNRFLKSE